MLHDPDGNVIERIDHNPSYNGASAYPIEPNTDLYAPVDGVKTEKTPDSKVHKSPRGFNIEVDKQGKADIIFFPDCCVPGYGEEPHQKLLGTIYEIPNK